MNLTTYRIAMVGCSLMVLGAAISGVLVSADKKQILSQAAHFDTSRGQMGFLIRNFVHREGGLGLAAIGAIVLAYSVLRKK